MFSPDGEEAVETESPAQPDSPLILSSSSPHTRTAKERTLLPASDSSNAMHNVRAVEQAMADLATSDSTVNIPLGTSFNAPQPQLDEDAQQEPQQPQGEPAGDAVQRAIRQPSTRIQAVGVPSELGDEELVRGIFGRFGAIQSVQLSSDVSSDSAASKRSAIIEYADESSASDAIMLDGFELNGSKLLVTYAAPALKLDSGMLSAEKVDNVPAALQPATQPVSVSAPIAHPVSFPRPPLANAAIPTAAPVAAPVATPAAAAHNPLTAPVDTSASNPSAPSTTSASTAPASTSTTSAAVARPVPTDVILHSPQFVHFKAHIPLTRIATSSTQSWSYYEVGSKSMSPLVLLHGTSGTAAVFYQQLLALSGRGYRVVSASWPPYWTVKEWVAGFLAFLDAMHIDRAHVFGAGLGGMLAMQFATDHSSRVDSLVLCNAYVNTLPFVRGQLWTQGLYWLPEFVVKEFLLQSYPTVSYYADTTDFLVAQLDALTAGDVASRLTLNSSQHSVTNLERIDQARVLLILPQDEVALPDYEKDRLLQALPHAKQALLKDGGDYPFISVADDVNLHLLVHLRGMGCLPLSMEEERAERDRQLEAAAEGVPTPKALDALKEPDASSRGGAMPLFRPSHSAAAGQMSVASAYEAISEQVEDERLLDEVRQNNSQAASAPHSPAHFQRQVSGPSLTYQTLGDTLIKATREEEEEKLRQRVQREDSLRMQQEVEARLKVIRDAQEIERKKRLHDETVLRLERERRKEQKNKEVMAQLGIDSTGTDGKPTRSYKRTTIFDE